MLYRQHRGSLAESMETVRDLPASMDALEQAVFADNMGWATPESGVKAHRYDRGDGDPRIGWPEVWIVMLDGSPCGFTNARPE